MEYSETDLSFDKLLVEGDCDRSGDDLNDFAEHLIKNSLDYEKGEK